MDKSILRHRLRSFLSTSSGVRKPALDLLKKFESHNEWGAYFFGGVPRDLALGPKGTRPRDIDLILANVSEFEIEDEVADSLVGKNRFGGLKLEVKGWPFDVWGYRKSWAFINFPLLFRTFEDVPKTTFLNIEAILVSIAVDGSAGRSVIDHGFFECIESRTLEINFEPNPFPQLCAIRSIYLAAKLDFFIGPNLASYLSRARGQYTVADLMEVQAKHYGKPRLQESDLAMYWDYVSQSITEDRLSRVRLPLSRQNQLRLWDYE